MGAGKAVVYAILVLLMYLPLAPGVSQSLRGWSLYAYWTLIGLVALAFSSLTSWGSTRERGVSRR